MKKIFKKFLVFSLVNCLLVISCINTTLAYEKSSETLDALKTCSVSIKENFQDNVVIVTIKKQFSSNEYNWDLDDFPNSELCEVSELTCKNNNNLRQILKLTLKKPSKQNVIDTIKNLEKYDFIYCAGPSYNLESCVSPITTNDPLSNTQYGLTTTNTSAAWNYCSGMVQNKVKVGVIDKGIASHPDLIANTTTGYDFVNNNTITSDITSNHGTLVAGVIGAVGNNSIGISGVCSAVSMVPLQTEGSTADMIEAIAYAESNNIHIVNISSGSYGYDQNYKNAIDDYDGLVVCAIGNDNFNCDLPGYSFYPACFDCDNIISVGAVNSSNNYSVYNYGPTTVDLMAPGIGIETTTVINGSYDYDTASGTSLSAPFVTGAAALLLSYNPSLTTAQLKNAILNNVTVVSSLSNRCATSGVLNTLAAIQSVDSGQVSNILVSPRITATNTDIYKCQIRINYNPLMLQYISYEVPSFISSDFDVSLYFPVGNDANNKYIQVEISRKSGSTQILNLNQEFIYLKFNTQANVSTAKNVITLTTNYLNNRVPTSDQILTIRKLLMGDVNNTNSISAVDSTLILRHIVGTYTIPVDYQQAADINRDGNINTMDALSINQYIDEIVKSFWGFYAG